MKIFKSFLLVAIMFCMLALNGCKTTKDIQSQQKPSVQEKTIKPPISSDTPLEQIQKSENDGELLYGKVPEPLLWAIAYNLKTSRPGEVELNKITMGDLKDIKSFFLSSEKLQKEWGFNSDEAWDFSIIMDMPNLRTLDIKGIRLKDYNILNCNSKLGSLDISYIDDEKAKIVAGLINLRGLTISDSTITNIDFLSNMKELWFLSLTNVPDIKSFDVLQSVEGLTYLEISNMLGSEDLKRLPPMENLNELKIVNNSKITNVSTLPYAPLLAALYLDGCGVTEVSLPLDKVPTLGQLSVANTPIQSIDNIKGLDNIAALIITGTGIRDVTPIKIMKEKGLLKRIQTVYIDNEFEKNKEILQGTGIEIRKVYMGE